MVSFLYNHEQSEAIGFADKVTRRRKEGTKCVSIYEIDTARAFSESSVLHFDRPDEDWLNYVSDNRAGKYTGKAYDFIFGPVANDDVYTTFALYIEDIGLYIEARQPTM